MARADGRVEQGQKLASAISARAWNRAQDAADIVLGARPGFEADGIRGPAAPYTAVYCRASVDVDRWGVLAINGMESTPTGTAGQFHDMPVIMGGTPTTNTVAFCVAVEPIASGKVGRVAVDGVVQCKLNVIDAKHAFAKAKASTTELDTAWTGEATVLWKDSGTGSGKWALVRLAGIDVAKYDDYDATKQQLFTHNASGVVAWVTTTGVSMLTTGSLTTEGLSFTAQTVVVPQPVTGATGVNISTTGCS